MSTASAKRSEAAAAQWAWLFSVSLLVLLAYYLCLQFVFPGYFSPLYPSHNDFYILPGLHIRNPSVMAYLEWPRPLGYLLADFAGRLGLQGSMLLLAAICLVNVVLTIRLVRQVIRERVSYLLAVAYPFLLFSHPDFYLNYVHDALATLSYFFLVLAMNAWYAYRHTSKPVYTAVCAFAFVCLAFTKETYFVSAICFWAVQTALCRGRQRQTAGMLLGVLVFFEAAGLLHNLNSTQPFIRLQADPASPYHVSFAPFSVMTTFFFYADRLLNPVVVMLVLGAVALLHRRTETLTVAASLIVGGLCALLPHSALPNHLQNMYSWVAAPLTFAAILFLPAPAGRMSPRRSLLASLALGSLILVSFWFNRELYEDNRWSAEQQKVNRNIITAYDRMKSAAASTGEILITGLKAPFHPFHTANYVRFEFGDHTRWTVVLPREGAGKTDLPVVFARPEDVDLSRFDHAFGFDDQGNLIQDWGKEQLQAALAGTTDGGLRSADLILFPALNELREPIENDPGDWYQRLRAGIVYWEWGQLDSAEAHLHRSLQLDQSQNPYPFFFLGQVKEARGSREEARHLYRKAVDLDSAPGNPAFSEALQRLEQLPADIGPS